MQEIQERLEKSLAHYVAMPTVPTDVAACSVAIKGLSLELAKLGMVTHIDGPVSPWLIATTTEAAMQAKRVKVLFVIHFDVVPFENEGQMTMRATPDKLFGRGVYDMKFAAACVKEMIADFAATNKLADYDFGVLITTDEEKGGLDGALNFLQQGWTAEIAVIPDGGYDWSIEARAKGILYMYLTAQGRAAHSSRPWLGDNPINRLAPALSKISQHFTNADQLGTIAVVNVIESSNSGVLQTTQIPGWARAGISVRAYTAAEIEAAADFIRQVATEHKLDMQVTLNEPPVALQPNNPYVKSFVATAAEVLGEPVKTSDAFAASDARHFAKYNIPTILMYPNGGDHHGPQEWIVRGDLYKYYRLCKAYIERVA